MTKQTATTPTVTATGNGQTNPTVFDSQQTHSHMYAHRRFHSNTFKYENTVDGLSEIECASVCVSINENLFCSVWQSSTDHHAFVGWISLKTFPSCTHAGRGKWIASVEMPLRFILYNLRNQTEAEWITTYMNHNNLAFIQASSHNPISNVIRSMHLKWLL